jgi:phospholipid/cholesterol/gamma-HCH transport system substrate-binding protein
MSEPTIHEDPVEARTARRELVLGGVVLALIALVAILSTTAINGSPLDSPYAVRVALPADGPILKRGADVRIAGRRAGTVRAVELDGGGRRAHAVAELDGARVGRGAGARVRLRGLAGVVYLEIDPGDAGRPLPSGARIGRARTSAGGQLTDVIAGFDADARRALGRTLETYGTGAAGRGPAVNRTLAVLPRLLRSGTAQLRALTPRPGTLAGLVGDARPLARAAADGGLDGAVAGARGTLERTGRRGDEITAALDELPATEAAIARTLPPVDGLLRRLAATAGGLRPAVRALRTALPALRAAEREAPGLDRLAALARDARPAVVEAAPLVREARGTAVALGPLADPVAALGRALVPYRRELVEAPAGFTRWGDFRYAFGRGAGHRAVRFSMIFTCAPGRRPYPAPGQARGDRKACGS